MYKRTHTIAGMVLALPAILIIVVLFFYPFLLTLINSFRVKDGWGFNNYQVVFDLYKGDLFYTLWISLVSLTILLLFGILLGGYLRLKSNRLIEFLFKIPLFVPFVVVGHAMRVFLAPNGTLNALLAFLGLIDPNYPPSLAYSSYGIIIALVWKNLSMALLLMMGAFRSVSQSFIEAAKNIGAGNLRIILTILLPMSKGAIAVASVLIFTSMISSFSIPIMMGSGTGPQMVMVDLYYQIVYQQDYGVANAIGVLSFVISMGAALYYFKEVGKR